MTKHPWGAHRKGLNVAGSCDDRLMVHSPLFGVELFPLLRHMGGKVIDTGAILEHSLFNSRGGDGCTNTISARLLLEIGEVSLRPNNPYRLASGIRSPIYIDCRILHSYHNEWLYVINSILFEHSTPHKLIKAGLVILLA